MCVVGKWLFNTDRDGCENCVSNAEKIVTLPLHNYRKSYLSKIYPNTACSIAYIW